MSAFFCYIKYLFTYIFIRKEGKKVRKIIPFEKEITFNTPISEITSISLEHTLNLEEDHIISGEFHINGDYKVSEHAQKEQYDYQLPFYIALDNRYDIKNTKVDIDNFYYESLDNRLKIHIDVYIEGLILQEEPKENIEKKEEELIRKKEEKIKEDRCYDEEDININIEKTLPEEEESEPIEVEINSNIQAVNKQDTFIEERKNNMDKVLEEMLEGTDKKSIFDSLDSNETFTSYYIYIVKEEDTIDKIMLKYNVTKEEIALYNDIGNIQIGDKLIIPQSTNE